MLAAVFGDLLVAHAFIVGLPCVNFIKSSPTFIECQSWYVAMMQPYWLLVIATPSFYLSWIWWKAFLLAIIPKDTLVSASYTITSPIVSASTDLPFQDHGLCGDTWVQQIRERGRWDTRAFMIATLSNANHNMQDGYLCVCALPDPMAWQCSSRNLHWFQCWLCTWGLANGFASWAYALRHTKLSHHTTAILCAAQVLLPMAICLHLCCKTHAQTPWNFDIIFFRLAERLAAQLFSLGLANPSRKLDDPSFSRALPALALSKEFCSDSSFKTYNGPPTIVSGIIIAAPQDQSNVQICMPLANVIAVICCHQLCSASSCRTRNPASLDKKSLVPALLSAPHMPHGAQMPFRCPICLTAPKCLLGAPYAFMAPHLPSWRPICLYGTPFAFMVPHLPFGAHICLNGAPFAFMAPHLPFGAPSAFCKPHLPFGSPIYLKRPMTKYVRQPKGALVLDSQSAICGWYNHHVQWPISSTNCFCKHLSHVSGCALIRVIILFGHIREKVLSWIFHMESDSAMSQESQIFGRESTQESCVLLLAWFSLS